LSGSDLDIIRTNAGQISTYTPQAFIFYDATSIDTYDDTKNIFDKINYGFFNKTTNDTYSGSARLEFQNNTVNIYSNNTYSAQTSTQIDLPAVALLDTFVVEDFAQNLSNKTFTDDTTFQQDIDVVDVRASGNIIGNGLLTMSDNTLEHPISNVYIGRQFSTTSDNYGLSVGPSQTDNSNFVITRNVSNNITVINSPAEVWTNINNQLRLKITENSLAFSPSLASGNNRFVALNDRTVLYRTNAISGVDAFANDTNTYLDFYTQDKDYDVRIRAVRRNASDGQGWFDTFAYRGRFWFGGTKMMEWGYINANNSFLMGRANSTWIQFNSNTEIYYQINGANRMTAGSNGYHYATLHVNTSDERLKSNIVDVSNALQTINTIEVKEFDKKCSMCCDDDDCTEELSHEIGFIAQQVEQTDMSFCVTTTQLNDTKGLKDSCIFSLNVKATQELYALVMKQQEEIINLSQRLNQTLDRLSKLENI
jgi:hypothetical protein